MAHTPVPRHHPRIPLKNYFVSRDVSTSGDAVNFSRPLFDLTTPGWHFVRLTRGAISMDQWWLFFAVGFGAQLIDGALGMAFGVLSNTALLAIGLPPAHASALIHTAEIFTTSASAASHIYHRNVDWRLVARMGITGVLGAILGAWILSNVDVSAARRFVYIYLLIMGVYILWKSVRIAAVARQPAGWTALLGFGAGFLDATGGGGWGPMTTSTLVGSGHAPRYSVGSVNTAEFFVTVSAATTFFAELGAVPLDHFVPLVLGGVLAAPFGGWVVRHVPARGLMTAVGVLIVLVSIFQIFRAFRVI
jgi:uncharacterized membrane protein YfcA